MTRISVISDTHGYHDERIEHFLSDADVVIHAGDLGPKLIDHYCALNNIYGVYGNIDDDKVRRTWPEFTSFIIDGVKIGVTHIAGRLGNYNYAVREWLQKEKPQIFICGHSHICKVQYDNRFKTLYINPGAAGVYGFHKVRTMLSFEIDAGKAQNLKVIELGLRA